MFTVKNECTLSNQKKIETNGLQAILLIQFNKLSNNYSKLIA